jgi:hypothetical protein
VQTEQQPTDQRRSSQHGDHEAEKVQLRRAD